MAAEEAAGGDLALLRLLARREGVATRDAALTPKARARAILRAGTKRPTVSVFAPLAHALGARIESLPLYDFSTSPQKLANGVVALRESLQIDSLTVACGGGIELEALGSRTDWISGRPVMQGTIDVAALTGDALAERLERGQRIAASLEATRRLGDARGEPLVIAGLTGPLTLMRDLGALGAFVDAADDDVLDVCGRIVLEEARLFLKAGCTCIVVLEEDARDATPTWASSIATVAKLARFYEALPLIAYASESPAAALGASAIACRSGGGAQVIPPSGPSGFALPTDERRWAEFTAGTNVVVTLGDVRMEASVEEARDACERMRDAAMNAT